MAKEKFDRTKPHVNIGTIGHVDHGKTTLAAAITSVLAKQNKAKKKDYSEIDKAPEEKKRGITIQATDVEFESDKRHYSLSDCPGHADYIKNMITGASELDGAILVVSSDDGVVEQSHEHMLLAKQIGIKNIVVFINDKTSKGLDEETKELLETDVQSNLEKYGYDKEKTPIMVASAYRALEDKPKEKGVKNPAYDPQEEAKILKLVELLDTNIPIPERKENEPFFMYIKDKFSITGQGTVVAGIVKRGKLNVGQEVELIGFGKKKKAVVKSIESHLKTLDQAVPGDDIGINLRGVEFEEVERGQVLANPGSISMHKKFKAQTYILSKEERGRETSFVNGYKPQFFFSALDITGNVELPGDKVVNPGDNVELTIELIDLVPIEKNSSFTIREGGKTVGTGVVTEIIE
jgi:elongation factor Tu